MKVSLILINDKLSNLYINTGYYAHEIANEIRKKGHDKVEVVEMYVDIQPEDLLTFLNSSKQLEQ